MSYNTKQKQLILDIIKKEEKDFTIKDIYNKLDNIGLTTIYRLIDKLVEEKLVDKHIFEGNITYYHYLEKCDEDNHFYLRCEKCHKTIHIDCDCIKDLNTHILKKHNFKLNRDHIIISGLCENCR